MGYVHGEINNVLGQFKNNFAQVGYKDTRIQGYKSDNYFIEFTIVIILK